MFRLDCTTDKYGELYPRWLDEPGKLLRWAGCKAKDRVLDLCGGTGAAAVEAVAMGCDTVVLLDRNPRCDDPRVKIARGDAEAAPEVLLEAHQARQFDLVICRQAIGYLDLICVGAAMWPVLAPGARFVFNAFREPRWSWKSYRHSGKRFLEASAYFGRTVFHLQASPTVGLDVTRFRWHTHEDIMRTMAIFFDVEHEFHGRSARYLCRRKERDGLEELAARWRAV